MKKQTLLTTSFALIWLDFPILYYTSVVLRDPLATTASLILMGVAVVIALAT